MKSFKLYLSLLLIMAFGMASCTDDFDAPPMNVPVATIQSNTTIADFKAKYWKDGNNYIDTIKVLEGETSPVIKGRVISSDATGNIYKSLVIQETVVTTDDKGVEKKVSTALALSINANSLYTTYRVGQEIVIDLKDMYVGKYAGLEQLGYPGQGKDGTWQASFMPLELFQGHAQLNGLPNPVAIDTVTTTIGALPTTPTEVCKMQSQLVRFDNVSWVEAGKPYSESEASTSRTLKDSAGNTIIVRNSNYATFRAELLPKGNGSVVGILGYFNNSWQLLLRSTADVIGFSTEAIEGSKDKPYTVAKALELQGQQKTGWTQGFIVGAVAPGVSGAVTSSDQIEWKAPATLANTIVVAPAADTKDITKCVIVNLPEGSALRAAANLKDNKDVYQKSIKINGELKTFMGQGGITTTGSAADFVLEGQQGEGDGTEANPFSVAQVKAGASGTDKWVSGYIVGWVDGMSLKDGAKFTVPATSSSNILMAASATEKDYNNCVPVQLPIGDLRGAINLMDNPTNLGKKLAIKGNLIPYFGVPGIKEGTAYILDGKPTEPTGPVDPVTSLNADFTGVTSMSGLPGWVSLKVSGDKSWFFTAFEGNQYASMTGYNGKVTPFDTWFITLPLNVKDAAKKTLSFKTNVNGYGSTTTKFEVYVMSTQDPKTAKMTKLNPTLATPPASGYAGMTDSGEINLAGMGDVVYIGFHYSATQDANYATWCVDDIKFGL